MIKNYFHISKTINLINVNVFQLNFLNQTLSQYKRSFFCSICENDFYLKNFVSKP